MPPHLIADLDRATNNNIEVQDQAYKDRTIRGYLTRVEQALSTLLPPRQSFRFDVKDLVRLDPKLQAEAFQVLWSIGSINGAEIRAQLGLDPIDDPALLQFFRPLNFAPLGQQGGVGTGWAVPPAPVVPALDDGADIPQPADLSEPLALPVGGPTQ